jgi:hypothetical protein
VLAAILRPGSAGANNAADHLDLFELALEQFPREALDGPILARSDSAGASHALAGACRELPSGSPSTDERVREAILALPEAAWRPAIDGDNQPRDGAWVSDERTSIAKRRSGARQMPGSHPSLEVGDVALVDDDVAAASQTDC